MKASYSSHQNLEEPFHCRRSLLSLIVSRFKAFVASFARFDFVNIDGFAFASSGLIVIIYILLIIKLKLHLKPLSCRIQSQHKLFYRHFGSWKLRSMTYCLENGRQSSNHLGHLCPRLQEHGQLHLSLCDLSWYQHLLLHQLSLNRY